MRKIIGFCLYRPVATLMFYCTLLLFGILAGLDMPVDYLPAIPVPKLVVTASYPGLPPKEIREMVTIPLEDTLSSLKGVKEISSLSRQDTCIIEIGFEWGTDMKKAGVETRELIDIAYAALPANAEKPVVLPVDPGERPVMTVAVSPRGGTDLSLVRRLCEREIIAILQGVDGLGSVTLVGGWEREIHVRVKEQKAAAYGLTLTFIRDAIAAINISFPAGTITEGELEYLVKADGRLQGIQELADLRIPAPAGGGWLPLKDLADIGYAPAEQHSLFINDGREAVGLVIRRQDDYSPVRLTGTVRKELIRLEESYGKDLSFAVVQDSSAAISRAVHSLLVSAGLGAGMAMLVIFLFLRRIASSLILLAAFPSSILFCILCLYAAGRSINIMSLGGMVLGIGMVVDNGIVVLENMVQRVLSVGRSKDAISAAAAEMAGSTFWSTCTTIVVFLPLIFLPGVIGALFTDLALSVSFSLIGSFFTSVTLVPVLFSFIHRRTENNRTGQAARKAYRSILAFFFRRPVCIILLLIGAAAAGAYGFQRVPRQLVSPVNSETASCTLEAEKMSSMEKIKEKALFLEQAVLKAGITKTLFIRAGGEIDDLYYRADSDDWKEKIHLTCTLRNPETGTMHTARDRFTHIVAACAGAVDVDGGDDPYTSLLGLRSNSLYIDVTADGQEAAREIAGDLSADIETAVGSGESIERIPSAEADLTLITPLRERITAAGLSFGDLSREVRASLLGSVSTQLEIEGEKIDVRITDSLGKKRPASMLEDISVLTPKGSSVRLADLAEITPVRRPVMLLRKRKKDLVTLRIDGPAADVRYTIGRILARPEYRGRAAFGDSGVIGENMQFIIVTFTVAFLLMYLVLGAQFESFVEPLMLLSTFPFSLSGIFLALAITGRSLDITSSLSVLILLGVSINNAIILFQTCKTGFMASGNASVLSAVFGSSVRRIVPVLITLCTTVLALVPISIDPGNENGQSGMAAAVIGGLLAGALLTVLVQPLLFYVYFKGKQRRLQKQRNRTS